MVKNAYPWPGFLELVGEETLKGFCPGHHYAQSFGDVFDTCMAIMGGTSVKYICSKSPMGYGDTIPEEA